MSDYREERKFERLADIGRVSPSTLRSSDGLVSAFGISATEDGCAPLQIIRTARTK